MVFSSIFFLLYFALFLALLGFWWFRKKIFIREQTHLPAISILIAARDEEAHLLSCLQSIEKLQYPKEKIEVLVGDDRSTDGTRAVVETFRQTHPYVTCLAIEHDLPGIKGKANVLAQLAHRATSDLFFFTDADIELPPTWVQAMLQRVEPGVGIVTGITATKGDRVFDKLQALDWLYALGLMQVIADRGLPVSTMGNNMLVTRQAYEATGGYEHIPFSITEDVQLFKQIITKGFNAVNVYEPEVLARTAPAPDFRSLLQQRRRWMRGSMHLPWYMVLLFVVHTAYYPVWLPFFWHTNVGLAGAIFGLKVGLQSLFLYQCLKQSRTRTVWYLYLLLEVYLLVSSVLLLFYFFVPSKIKWKGRHY